MSGLLAGLDDCFDGVIPSIIATLDPSGEPNVSYLSQVYRVDERHVAVSNQFFSKTAINVKATGRATLLIVNGRTGAQHSLGLVHLGSLREGRVFQHMAAQLQAISSQQHVGEAMELRSAEIYRVDSRADIAGPPVSKSLSGRTGLLGRCAQLSAELARLTDAEALIDHALDGLSTHFGFGNMMVLVANELEGRLTALASRGYATGGAGAEVELGQGLIGICAATGQTIRLSDTSRGQRMANAVKRERLEESDRHIPLVGLTDPYSQLAAPMISQGVVQGVLFAESPERYFFDAEDEAALSIIANQLATGLRLADADDNSQDPDGPVQVEHAEGAPLQIRLYAFDDSIFIDDTYLIKGVAGRLLHHFLSVYATTGRRDFSNREIRLEPSLRLPGLKDNLETRLILLKRRLDERQAPVRLARPGRGQIQLVFTDSSRVVLETATSAVTL